jgi:hypothetical protein
MTPACTKPPQATAGLPCWPYTSCVNCLVRYSRHRTLPRPTETRLLAAFLRPIGKQRAQPPQLLRPDFAQSGNT